MTSTSTPAESDDARARVAPIIVRVLVDSPLPQLDRLFDYEVPEHLAADIRTGIRVRVPLRSAGRIADAFVVEIVTGTDSPAYSGTLSAVEAIVSTAPVLAPEVWALARRVADRAAGGASDVLRLAVPKRQVRVEKAWLAATSLPSATEPPARIVSATVGVVDPPAFDPQRVIAAIDGRERLAVDAVPRVVPLVASDGESPIWVGHWTTTMAAAATRALAHGSVILCVPDYRDQEQLFAAISRVVPAERIVQLDARRSGPDRYRGFLSCLSDEPRVIIGNRSVVYAPAANLALIALWDDGDPLHAEPLAPYVNARDAALVRQELQGCGLWFVGHARSTEVQRLVGIGFLGELSPVKGISPRVLPTAQQTAQDRFAAIARIPSTAWREARAALEHGPVLVQVARPGYAPRLACTACGESARCLRCEGPLGTRTARSIPACGWCGALAVEWHCDNCGGEAFRQVGQGATRTADELGRAFPGVRVIVADGDHPVLSIDAEPALVVSTRGAEPIAAGGYRAVLLLDGERMLARESLRVGEDCIRWWSNAAALAAPGAPVVLVGVGGALASAMATWRLAGFASAELADRRRLRFPPSVRVATVTGDAAAVDRALAGLALTPGPARHDTVPSDSVPPHSTASASTAPSSIYPSSTHPSSTDPSSIAPDAARPDSRFVDVLGPVEKDDGTVRAIVRFDYAGGAAVTSALRSAVVKNATARRKRIAGAARAPLPTLRVRLDDLALFDE